MGSTSLAGFRDRPKWAKSRGIAGHTCLAQNMDLSGSGVKMMMTLLQRLAREEQGQHMLAYAMGVGLMTAIVEPI